MNTTATPFDDLRSALIGQPVSHLWQGYGSALFLEIGALTPNPKPRRDGSARNPRGVFCVMLDCPWRVEDETSIVCGSADEPEVWARVLPSLAGATVADLALVGRLPELSIGLSCGLWLTSCTCAEEQPSWTVFDRRGPTNDAIHSRAGRIIRTDASKPTG